MCARSSAAVSLPRAEGPLSGDRPFNEAINREAKTGLIPGIISDTEDAAPWGESIHDRWGRTDGWVVLTGVSLAYVRTHRQDGRSLVAVW